MRGNFLKRIRLIVSIAVFVCITLIFVNIYSPSPHFKFFTAIQFVPSLLRFISTPAWVACAFIIILLITFFFGRLYCSFICPLGTLQDIFIRISRKLKIKRRFRQTKAHNILRYSILGLVFLSLVTGLFDFLTWLDPYSIFGRMATHLLRPIVYGINNLSAMIAEWFGNHSIHFLSPKSYSIPMIILAALSLSFIGILSIFRGRLYCNTICPVGSLLSLVSRYQIFGIKFSQKTPCIACKKCAMVCKAECIDVNTLDIDDSRCIACFSCIGADICKFSILSYERETKKSKKKELVPSSGRRNFFRIALPATAIMGMLPSKSIVAETYRKAGQLPWKRSHPTTPPGSIGLSHFLNNCTACHACVNACPTKVLQPTLFEYGVKGMMAPRMDFVVSFCNYECNSCGQICPTGAIKLFSIEDKKIIQIGKAVFVSDNCVVHTRGTFCGACAEHCPTRAIEMVPYQNLLAPKVNQNLCIGCGGCEYICPTRPYRAIYIESCNNHGLAQKFSSTSTENREYIEEEFPF